MKKLAPPIPHQHGAWALLYGPFAMALGILGPGGATAALLLLSISGLFLAHEPLSKLARRSPHGVRSEMLSHWKHWLAIYLTLTAVSGSVLLLYSQRWLLVPAGLLAGLFLTLHLALISQRKERTAVGELVGVIGLTTTGPVACYAIGGAFNWTSWLVWLFSILYFSSGVFFVKMRVSRFTKRHEQGRRIQLNVAYHLLVIGLVGWLWWAELIPFYLPLALVPGIVRALVGIGARDAKLNLKRIGYTEVAYSVVFVLLFVLAWHLSPSIQT